MQRSQVDIIKQEREVLKRSDSRERCLKFHISENEVASPLPSSPSKVFPAARGGSKGEWAIAAHGGAGAISDTSSIPARMQEFSAAFEIGTRMLQQGAFAVDAVQEVVARLEDSAYFNAGRGSVFTNAGTHEMDASIMDGTTGCCGAVAMRPSANFKFPRVPRTNCC
jgi:hypothetical protein